MRKITMITLVVFCTGVLLGGIGTGVAIGEYTSLEYTGEHILGGENLKQENMEITVVPVEGKKIYIQDEYPWMNLVYDSSVPEHVIRYSVTYNPNLVNLKLRYEENNERSYWDGDSDGEENREQGYVWLRHFYNGHEFDQFMKNKDNILKDLKQGKIGSYRLIEIEEIVVSVNPQMKDYVVFN